jgi:hypothetical protein
MKKRYGIHHQKILYYSKEAHIEMLHSFGGLGAISMMNQRHHIL